MFASAACSAPVLKFKEVTLITWELPTAYANGDPLPIDEIAGVYANCGAISGSLPDGPFIPGAVTETLISAVIEPTISPIYCNIQVEGTNGTISEPSQEIKFYADQGIYIGGYSANMSGKKIGVK